MRTKVISCFLSRFGLPTVIFTAVVNHIITFFVYGWYQGMDSYSYDICGLQIVTGKIFDFFSIMFRPSFVPIIKNILYLLFEGHRYALCLLLHLIGILTGNINKESGKIEGMIANYTKAIELRPSK